MIADLPLLDYRAWRQGSGVERADAAGRLDAALADSGFVLVTDGGSLAARQSAIREMAGRFFRLPASEKARYATSVGGRGWIPFGREANSYYGEDADPGRPDMKESYTIGRELDGPGLSPEWFAPNVWPETPAGLAPACLEYAESVQGLYRELLEICAVALGLPGDWFVRRCSRAPHSFNINRYPPRAETGPARPGQYRIAPHTDWGILTFLDRQAGYGGLQIETPDGEWVDAPFVDGAFTVNVGDLLARWTGGRWRSSRHRVLPPPEEAPGEELVSLIVFLEADMDTVIEPVIAGGVDYAPVTAADYLRERTLAASVI